MILLLLLGFQAFADVGMTPVGGVGQPFGQIIYYGDKCPGECVEVPENTDLTVSAVLNGKLVVDPVKKAAKDLARANKEADLAAKEAQAKDLKNAKNIPEMSAKLDALISVLQEKGVISK